MISDSPYHADEPVLAPAAGVVSGLVGASTMLSLLLVLQPLSGVSPGDVLARIGARVMPHGVAGDVKSITLAGGVLHELIGALLGLLFAVSLRRLPIYGLVGVGVLYGVVIWVLSGLVAFLFWRQTLWVTVHSLWWLCACAGYGLFLAGCAVWADTRRASAPAVVVPQD